MNKYIFPGADASLPPGSMLKAQEKSNFELQSIENIGVHYSWTIRKWHANWMSNREKVIEHYGERWYRIWHFFLAWSSIIADQGSSACYQMAMHKNLDHYDRGKYITGPSPSLGVHADEGLSKPSLESLEDGEFGTDEEYADVAEIAAE